ncbi:MAG: hypothetical protein M0P66_18810 [Salinivirgaceae bacterium]|nr:hypothetical protein [Salinivirgaceae bacterium]
MTQQDKDFIVKMFALSTKRMALKEGMVEAIRLINMLPVNVELKPEDIEEDYMEYMRRNVAVISSRDELAKYDKVLKGIGEKPKVQSLEEFEEQLRKNFVFSICTGKYSDVTDEKVEEHYQQCDSCQQHVIELRERDERVRKFGG